MLRIGIDPSLNSTGVCINDDGIYTYYIIPSKMTRRMQALNHTDLHYLPYELPEGDDEYVKSYKVYQICRMIEYILKSHQPLRKDDKVQVFIEGVSYGSVGSRALVDLAGLNFAIRNVVINMGIPLRVVPPTSWKKELIGNGQATKEMVVDIWKRLSGGFGDAGVKVDDVADAYFLSKMPVV